MQSPGCWTAERLISVVIVWTMLSNVFYLLVVTISCLVAVALWDWEMVGRHSLRGVYACLAMVAIVYVCRCLYYRVEAKRP